MSNRYLDIKVTRTSLTSGSRYYINAIYPDVPVSDTDYYVITTIEDRLDLLAYNFYKDPSLWWVIASANALPGDSIYPPIGMQLRIPIDVQTVIGNYKIKNNGF